MLFPPVSQKTINAKENFCSAIDPAIITGKRKFMYDDWAEQNLF